MATPTFRNYVAKKRYIPKNTNHEERIQRAVCGYLRTHYEHVIFRSDYASGLQLTQNQANVHRSLQSSRAFPDLFIYHPKRGFHGLALELKRDGVSIYCKIGPNKGQLVSDPHIREQAAMLQRLNEAGYLARFAVGYDEAVRMIDAYMGVENQSLF